jgi:parallel beta-helix repeat protein
MTTFPRRVLLGVVWAATWLPAAIAPPAQARTIYVRESGDDINSGSSPAQAVKTINRGAALAAAGDTVLVGPGTYFEGNIRPAVFGQVRFVADRRGQGTGDPAGDVVIDATGFQAGFDINGKLAVTVDGFVISSGAIGIYVKSGSHSAVVSNNVVSNSGDGIYVQASRDAVIFNNLVYNNTGTGILVAPAGNEGSLRARIVNNTVYRNMNRGIFLSGTTVGSPNALVLNNIVEKNERAGIQVNATSQPGFLSAGNVLFENNFAEALADVTDRVADPLFIDPGGADNALGGINYADDNFRLQHARAGQAATSPAVDAGSDTSRRLHLLRASTRSDGKPDRGFVDAGYHYTNFGTPPPNPGERLRPRKLYLSQAGGDDANDGATRATAVRTLSRAFALARGGHQIMVLGGVFSEQDLRPPSGRPGRPVIIKALGGARIDGSAGASGLLFGGVRNVVVDGLRVSGADDGIDIRNSPSDAPDGSNIVLRRCRLSNNSGRGLTVSNSTGVQVVGCVIENNALRGVQVDGSAVAIERSTIRGNDESGVWAFDRSTVTLSESDLIDNRTDGILAERSSTVNVVGGTISGSIEGGARYRSGSSGVLENVQVIDNNDVGVQVISGSVTFEGGNVLGNGIGVQSFVDPVSRDAVALHIEGTHVCNNRRIGIDAQTTALTAVDADLCTNGDEGLRQRGGAADLLRVKIRGNLRDGIAATDAARLLIQQAAISDNGGNGVQVVRSEDFEIHDSSVRTNGGDGLRIMDSPAAVVVNNLIHNNSSTGTLISGDSIGSPDARVAYNTFFRNGNRGLLIGGDDTKPASDHAVVTANIFNGNINAGIQVNVLSRVGYEGDFNLSTDPYGAGTDPGLNDLLVDPLFVAPEAGDFHLSQTAAGQGVSSPAVNAGNTTAAASGMAAKTTRTDKVVDSGIVDLGYHYLP